MPLGTLPSSCCSWYLEFDSKCAPITSYVHWLVRIPVAASPHATPQPLHALCSHTCRNPSRHSSMQAHLFNNPSGSLFAASFPCPRTTVPKCLSPCPTHREALAQLLHDSGQGRLLGHLQVCGQCPQCVPPPQVVGQRAGPLVAPHLPCAQGGAHAAVDGEKATRRGGWRMLRGCQMQHETRDNMGRRSNAQT